MALFDLLRQAVLDSRPVALATAIAGSRLGAKLLIEADGDLHGSLGDAVLDRQVSSDALVLLDAERNETRTYSDGNTQADILIETYPAPPHLVIVGAVHTAIPLVSAAKLLGFRVSVVDPRAAFATPERFPDVDELIVEWPDEALPKLGLNRSTYIAVLTHDPKFDDPAVRVALAHPVRYIGALGSPRTQARRRAALLEAGVDEAELARIHGPIGLPIGGKSPGELAISIMAEIIAVRRGKHP